MPRVWCKKSCGRRRDDMTGGSSTCHSCSPRLPDRRLFLDYCHLTGEGWRRPPPGLPMPSTSIVSTDSASPPQPDPHAAACAHLLAAIHNAHYGQPADVVAYHATRARRLDPNVRGLAAAIGGGEPPLRGLALQRMGRVGPRAASARYLGAAEMM